VLRTGKLHTSATAGVATSYADPVSSLRTLTALLVGGFVGTVVRALLADAWVHDPSAWPWATFVVNVGGALLLGIVVALLRVRPAASLAWRPLLGTGLCGGLTTFSTLQLELVRMFDADAAGLAAAYLAASLALGLLAVVAGLRLGAAIPASAGIDIPVGASGGVPVGTKDPIGAARRNQSERGRG
jgi:CrcB protein